MPAARSVPGRRLVDEIHQAVPVVDLDIKYVQSRETQNTGNFNTYPVAHRVKIEGYEILSRLTQVAELQNCLVGGIHIFHGSAQPLHTQAWISVNLGHLPRRVKRDMGAECTSI